VEKFITDTAWEEGWVEPIVPGPSRGQSVGVIGAGPAGLATAEYMRVAGYDVHVYDRHDRAGGLLTYGIPGFKLEKHVVMRRVDRLKAGGIVFHESFEVGRDAKLDELRSRHDAILIATGVYKARAIKAPGVGAPGVVESLDYLIASNRKGFGDAVPGFDDGSLNAAGKHVVVIGGGDTAMDCVRTAVRQGAKSVKCLYRRDRANMSAACAWHGCVSVRPTQRAAAHLKPIRAASSGSTPISSSRRWALMLRICQRCSVRPTSA
jgi:glutamate synthase (NADPH/NADH) small chain